LTASHTFRVHSNISGNILNMAPVDFDNPGKVVMAPIRLAHVVLRTNQYEKMRDFYTTFLGGHVQYGNDMLCFIAYDDEHHRIALANVPGTGDKVVTSSGLEHIAFTFPNVNDLLLSYRQRLANGIRPLWCVHHGITASLYYRDPDGNVLETQVDTCETAEEANEYMMNPEFAENPIGVDFDPEDWIERLKKGEDPKVFNTRGNIGPRGLDTVPFVNGTSQYDLAMEKRKQNGAPTVGVAA